MEINNKETIGIAEVESLCNKRISYEMNFLIGNICDLIEVDGENEEQVDQRNILTLLQKESKIWRSKYDSNFYFVRVF